METDLSRPLASIPPPPTKKLKLQLCLRPQSSFPFSGSSSAHGLAQLSSLKLPLLMVYFHSSRRMVNYKLKSISGDGFASANV